MQMMKFFSTSSARQPFMPYFGDGGRRLQPVSVKDVACCFVAAISNEATVGKSYDLGGPEAYTWKELYDLCALAIAGRKRLKIGVPVPVAKLLALTIMKVRVWPSTWLIPYPFNLGQVAMSQEDSVCDPTPVEKTYGIKLRNFREELTQYANQIP
jgi:NADH dehydrogenase